MKGSYFGGKSGSGTYQTIINQIPPHKHYIEGFAGMAGVLRNMKTLASCLLIEKDPLLFPTYHQAGFVETASINSYVQKRAQPFRMCMNDDAIGIFETYALLLDTPSTFIYLDPPYPLDSRKSGPKYRFELTEDDHRVLLTSINEYGNAYSGYSGPGTNCILNQNGYITITKNIYVGRDIDGSEEVNETRSIKHAKKSKGDPEGLILKITPSMMAAVIDEIVKPRQLLMF